MLIPCSYALLVSIFILLCSSIDTQIPYGSSNKVKEGNLEHTGNLEQGL